MPILENSYTMYEYAARCDCCERWLQGPPDGGWVVKSSRADLLAAIDLMGWQIFDDGRTLCPSCLDKTEH